MTAPRYVWQPRGYSADELRRARAACRDAPEPEPDDEDEPAGAEYLAPEPERPRRVRARRPPGPPVAVEPRGESAREYMYRTGTWPRGADGRDMLAGVVEPRRGGRDEG